MSRPEQKPYLIKVLSSTGRYGSIRYNKINTIFLFEDILSFQMIDILEPSKRSLESTTEYIFLSSTYKDIIKSSSQNFEVQSIKSDDILNFKDWWPSFYKKNPLSKESYGKSIPQHQKQSFARASFMHFEYSSSIKGAIITRDDFPYPTPCSHTFVLQKAIGVANISLSTEKAYMYGKVTIQRNKLLNLQQLEPCVEDEYKNFYREINQ
ncbi:hypothetical protein QE152_g9487 [Popillia japonica]|uniref:Uncharacterized protein n=1 Tax=Popillia japonica TaxID=7064 RepID=A0AAW1LYX2_POPJA